MENPVFMYLSYLLFKNWETATVFITKKPVLFYIKLRVRLVCLKFVSYYLMYVRPS